MSAIGKKFLIKPKYKCIIINQLQGYRELLGELPDGVVFDDKPNGTYDFVHLFAGSVAELDKLAPSVMKLVKPDTVFWISYPKKTGKIKTDLNRDSGWDSIKKAGYQGVSLISIDDTWSAMRFRPIK